VARQVAQRLPHVLLAGLGAARFADEIGAERREMLSDFVKNEWRKKLNEVDEDGNRVVRGELINLVNEILIPKPGERNESHDTMNVIVRDTAGHLVSAVTTSGLAWKYPGRVGDSPVIGAGNYCDDRYGAAACMGLGEITMRLSSSARAVFALAAGKPLHEAGNEAVREMLHLIGPTRSEDYMERADWVRLLLIDKDGNVGGYATRGGLQYKLQALADDAPQVMDCEWVR
jgi:beta-aspartyl-peptidase (threonine type)